MSSISNGLDVGEGLGRLFSRVRSTDIPPADGVTGVREPDERAKSCPGLDMPVPPWVSPALTRVPIALCKSPPTFFKAARFCLSSLNPISYNLAKLVSKSAGVGSPTSVPNNFEGLFRLGGVGDRSRETGRGAAASRFALEDNGKIEDADLNPNLIPVLGGRGGGWSSEFVLPVCCCVCALGVRSWYFCLINLSIAESASSASKGMGGLAFCGLYIRFDEAFPTRFMF